MSDVVCCLLLSLSLSFAACHYYCHFMVIGEFVGHEEFTLGLPYSTQVIAVDKCCYYTLSKGDINELISSHEDAAFELQVHRQILHIRFLLLQVLHLSSLCPNLLLINHHYLPPLQQTDISRRPLWDSCFTMRKSFLCLAKTKANGRCSSTN